MRREFDCVDPEKEVPSQVPLIYRRVLVAISTAGTGKSGDRKVVKMGEMAEKRALKAVYALIPLYLFL